MLPAKILLISADLALSHSLSACLSQAGYQVHHTPRGIGAVDLIHSENPHLVVVDSDLPDFNSMAIIRAMRSDEFNHRIPVILIGTSLTDEAVLLGLEVGADLCLQEAFHPQVFIARVRSLLRRSELVKAQ